MSEIYQGRCILHPEKWIYTKFSELYVETPMSLPVISKFQTLHPASALQLSIPLMIVVTWREGVQIPYPEEAVLLWW